MSTSYKPADFTRLILNCISDGVFTIDEKFIITSFNKAAEKITKIPAIEAIGRPCYDAFHSSICEGRCALQKTLTTGEPIVDKPIFIVNSEGEKIPVSISTGILRDDHDNFLGGVETFRDLSDVSELRKRLSSQYTFADIISKSPAMRKIFAILPQVAESDATVLIEGASGTGKELIARALHNLSLRKPKPFITVNCGALPDTLLESELFGYKKGAFTDAKQDKPGRFALAHKGSIFLDEIGDVSNGLTSETAESFAGGLFRPTRLSKFTKNRCKGNKCYQ